MSEQCIDLELIEEFLISTDSLFPVPLSHKQDLHILAQKFYSNATICARIEDGRVVSAVIGYTKKLRENKAYISVVATMPYAQGKGVTSSLIRNFIELCKKDKITAVHLYVVPGNIAAIRMYEKIGFEPYILSDEPRPEDLHLIYYI